MPGRAVLLPLPPSGRVTVTVPGCRLPSRSSPWMTAALAVVGPDAAGSHLQRLLAGRPASRLGDECRAGVDAPAQREQHALPGEPAELGPR